ncbi:MAG: ABC transporter permease [Tistrella sp.]|jgi:peptide/nickel transport system permease protein|uniref:ABC transporter permease n=1 Tax=Tistrella mobilis TaxID=171437 RepID=A0A162LRA2_9PROT|nr:MULTISPECIES: ABC transporter permease [Tistrella]KYO56439.1 diguanylate cyclase [Tistrella mobilis]MAD37320.1 ABC transporter permease [Tistrella sp.]MAM76657.1 ABC transporter permease [Tistrella sp.]MBA77975.1 ABC transporter permease [Tistrella sp.]HAE50921.1 ABC transporter permease [Tistrella mobilis]
MSRTATPSAAGAAPRRRNPVLAWMLRDPRGALSLLVVAIIALTGIFADQLAPYSPIEQNFDLILMPPSAENWLGTDDLGRDVFSRLIHGASASMYASVLSVSIALVIGLPIGLLAGFAGGWVDEVVSRVIDALLSFPAIVLAIGVTGALGVGLTNGMISVGIVFSPLIARLARARALVVKEELFVDAARCFGASPVRILARHILPNAIQPILVQVTLLLAGALLAEASLSFLGLGVQAPDASWGSMLAKAYLYMEIAPEQMVTPGLAILVTALAFNGLGDSVRMLLDPTTRSGR